MSTRCIVPWTHEEAQTQAEYALLMVGLVLIAAAAAALMGAPISHLYQAVTDALA